MALTILTGFLVRLKPQQLLYHISRNFTHRLQSLAYSGTRLKCGILTKDWTPCSRNSQMCWFSFCSIGKHTQNFINKLLEIQWGRKFFIIFFFFLRTEMKLLCYSYCPIWQGKLDNFIPNKGKSWNNRYNKCLNNIEYVTN